MSSILVCWSLGANSLANWLAAIASSLIILALSTHERDFLLGNRTFKSSQPSIQRQEAKIHQCITRSDCKQNHSHFSTLVTRPHIPPIGNIAPYNCHSEQQLILSRNHFQDGIRAMSSKSYPILLTDWQLLKDMSYGTSRSHNHIYNTILPFSKAVSMLYSQVMQGSLSVD